MADASPDHLPAPRAPMRMVTREPSTAEIEGLYACAPFACKCSCHAPDGWKSCAGCYGWKYFQTYWSLPTVQFRTEESGRLDRYLQRYPAELRITRRSYFVAAKHLLADAVRPGIGPLLRDFERYAPRVFPANQRGINVARLALSVASRLIRWDDHGTPRYHRLDEAPRLGQSLIHADISDYRSQWQARRFTNALWWAVGLSAAGYVLAGCPPFHPFAA